MSEVSKNIQWALIRISRTNAVRNVDCVYKKKNGDLSVITPKNAEDFNPRIVYYLRCENKDCKKIHNPEGYVKVTIVKLGETAEELSQPSDRRLRYAKLPDLESSDAGKKSTKRKIAAKELEQPATKKQKIPGKKTKITRVSLYIITFIISLVPLT